MSKEIIRVKNLCRYFGKRKILNNINVQFKKGETVLIAGNNGSGKSSFLRILAGTLYPDSGALWMDESIPREKIAFISDRMSLFGDFSLDRGIAFHAKAFGIKTFDYALIDQLNLDRKQRIRDLSKGERAIYHLSLLLSQEPEILLLDEIIHTIDPYLREVFLNALIDLIDELNATVLMVNHTFSEMGRIPERVLIMENGRFIFDEMSDNLQQKIKKIVVDSETEEIENITNELPVIFKHRSPLYHEYYIYPFKQEYETKMNVNFQDVDLSEIIKSFIGGYYAKKRV
jgi:ABC-2 type transport system ATP-binding protein